MCGQTFNLLNVEYGVALHAVDFTLRIIAGMLIGLLACDGIGIHDQRAFFAFAHMPAQLMDWRNVIQIVAAKPPAIVEDQSIRMLLPE